MAIIIIIIIVYYICIYTLDWAYNAAYDPVKEAAAYNAANGVTSSTYTSSGGNGPPGGNGSPGPEGFPLYIDYKMKDTEHLANYMSQCPRGNNTFNCGLEREAPNGWTARDLCSIWAHVKDEHPEFANNSPFNNTTIINNTLIRNVASLNKNYPRGWP
jgi:hypothetical protein